MGKVYRKFEGMIMRTLILHKFMKGVTPTLLKQCVIVQVHEFSDNDQQFPESQLKYKLYANSAVIGSPQHRDVSNFIKRVLKHAKTNPGGSD